MRLPGYDYSQPGWYFVSIRTKNRREVFGVVEKGEMRLNQLGKIVMNAWQDLPNHYYCILDECIVMPNHVHAIIVIPELTSPTPTAAAGLRPAAARGDGDGVVDLRPAAAGRGRPTTTVGITAAVRESNGNLHASLIEIIRALKSFSARRINELRGMPGQPVWQRSFHEHILRGNNDIEMVREYIRLNPEKWNQDRNNVKRNDNNMVH